jgi:predicted transglutaminase-like cysteine proteinase
MVLVSISPYASRKTLVLIVGLICLFSLSCFAESVYLSVSSTPYDKQMTRIRPALLSTNATVKQNVSLSLVNHWIENLREIPYGFSPEWKTPAEVELDAVADCKGKAVALYDVMHSHGAENVRLVIGKRTLASRKTHAWVEWNTNSGTYVLDPTINWTAYRAEQRGVRSYIPLYAYAGARKYRAAGAALYAKN